ncbi:hypothetical protein LTR94_012044 [Friedmanniomyces endolithicus]|nr:hypothetical protein LTR94_012044 [Friedmanniomyces endolithicus]
MTRRSSLGPPQAKHRGLSLPSTKQLLARDTSQARQARVHDSQTTSVCSVHSTATAHRDKIRGNDSDLDAVARVTAVLDGTMSGRRFGPLGKSMEEIAAEFNDEFDVSPDDEGDSSSDGEGDVSSDGGDDVSSDGEDDVSSDGEGDVSPDVSPDASPDGEGDISSDGEGDVSPDVTFDDEFGAELAAALDEPAAAESADELSSPFGDEQEEAETERTTAAESSAGVSAPALATSSGPASATGVGAADAATEIAASAQAVTVATSSVPAVPTVQRGLALPSIVASAPAQASDAETAAIVPAISTARQGLALPTIVASAPAQYGVAESMAPKPAPALPPVVAAPLTNSAKGSLLVAPPPGIMAPYGGDESESPKKWAYVKKDIKSRPFLYYCRFASLYENDPCCGQFVSVESLRNHMHGVHQLFPLGKTTHMCSRCCKRFADAKSVHPDERMCDMDKYKLKWCPQRVEEMSQQEMADTWCLEEHGEPSESVKEPNERYEGKAIKAGTKRKAPADDELLITGSGPAKHPRTELSVPASMPTPANTPPAENDDDDDDVEILGSVPVAWPSATFSPPPSATMPAYAPAEAPLQEPLYPQQIWGIQPALGTNFSGVSAPPQAPMPWYQAMQAPALSSPYEMMAAQYNAAVPYGFSAAQSAAMPGYGATQPLQYGQPMGIQPGVYGASVGGVSTPWNPAVQGDWGASPLAYGGAVGVQPAFQGSSGGIFATWDTQMEGYGDLWVQGQQQW